MVVQWRSREMKERVIQIQQREGIAFVRVIEKKLYQNMVVPFQEELVSVVDQGNDKLIVDLSNVDVINSSGLGVLILVSDRLHQIGGKLVVTGLRPLLKELFQRMRLDSLFIVAEDQKEALKAI
jgi:anti-sigma B factor antagonist